MRYLLFFQLYPPDSTILEHSKKEMSDAKQYARKLMVVNLSDKANDEKKKEEDTIRIDPVRLIDLARTILQAVADALVTTADQLCSWIMVYTVCNSVNFQREVLEVISCPV